MRNVSEASLMVRRFPICYILHLTRCVDDLPVIRDTFKKGFLETQSKVNSWVANLKKKIDGEDEDDFGGRPRPAASGYNTGSSRQQSFGRRSSDYPKRSADHDRYDADPQVLGNDFTDLQLKDHEGTAAPDLFCCDITNPDSCRIFTTLKSPFGEPRSF